ncbi:MAG: 1-acyl-sn-glycerol-3-phosphate acyltransferase [Candidatus Magasanikbacteria bacterium]|nr:1-acyl-sn-glycerol-3-phosphate acyltransferase [Candidatus Magasanikbacteria bacterium]
MWQTEGVREFVEAQLPELAARLEIDEKKLIDAFMRSFEISLQRMGPDLNQGFLDAVPEGLDLLHLVEPQLLASGSTLSGGEHLAEVLDFLAKGGNVLVVQNHTSGADTSAFRELVRQHHGEPVMDQAILVAGHVVNLYLIPLTIMCGLRFFPIFSAKYKEQAQAACKNDVATEMAAQNRRAMMAMVQAAQQGGKMMWVYPEGGRGDGRLLQGHAQVAKIPELIASASSRGLMIWPTYIEATDILPVHRIGEDEFCEFVLWMKRGRAHAACGKPMMWKEICPSENDVCAHATGHDVSGSIARKQILHVRIMRAIASLAPTEYAKGPWV